MDQAVFYWINQSWANPVLDRVFPFLTDFDNFRIPMLASFVALAIFGGRKGRITFLMVAIGVAITDQTASHLLKPLVGRIRPCNTLEGVRLLVSCSGSFSFPSAHAANMTGGAVLLSFRYPRLKTVWIAVAGSVGLSRVYVGVHYPLDVLGGIGLGLAAAGMILGVHAWIVRAWRRRRGTLSKIATPSEPTTPD